jgi:hypothetical protein
MGTQYFAKKMLIGINIENLFGRMAGHEVADCLRILADQIEGLEDPQEIDGHHIQDEYGNNVGLVAACN